MAAIDDPSPSVVEFLRKLLKLYEDGLLTESEVSVRALHFLIKPHLEWVQMGQVSTEATSWCGAELPPPMKARVEMSANRISFYPIAPIGITPRGAGCTCNKGMSKPRSPV